MNKPYFLISKKVIYNQIEILKQHFNEVSYSWKTNPHIGEILNEKEDCFFSVHSINELEQLKNKNKVWYFALAWTEKDLDILFEKYNQKNFVVDNEEDLETLLKYIKKNNKKISLLLRMKLRENTLFTGKHYVFGMKIKQIQKLIPKLRENELIDKLGVHFHRKTQNVSEWSLKEEVAQSLGEEFLSKIDIMNLGGGLPANYINIHDKSIDSIFSKTDALRDYVKQFNIELIIEPGRFIAAPSIKLISHIKAIHDNTCFLDVSIFNGALDTVVANIKLPVEGELEKGEKYLLKGLTPDSTDILRYSVYLDNPKIGDEIVFLNCGAYTYTTNFCALDNIEIKIVEEF